MADPQSPSRFVLVLSRDQRYVLHTGQCQDAGRHLGARLGQSSQAEPAVQTRAVGMDKVGDGVRSVTVAPQYQELPL